MFNKVVDWSTFAQLHSSLEYVSLFKCNRHQFSIITLGEARQNQISFIGLVSSKDYYERPNGMVCEKGLSTCQFLSGVMCAQGMGTSENMDNQLASRGTLNDLTDDALTISAGSSFQKFPNTESVLATVLAFGGSEV